jgi:hypothetical protein
MSIEDKQWFKDWKEGYQSAFEDKLEDILAQLYAMDCNIVERVSVSWAVAELCDEKLDRSGALLGRVRDRAYEIIKKEKEDG